MNFRSINPDAKTLALTAAKSTYHLKFKVIPGVDQEYIDCDTFEAAVSEVDENANELEWALKISGIPTQINSEDVTKKIIEEINYRELHPDWDEREDEIARREISERRADFYAGRM